MLFTDTLKEFLLSCDANGLSKSTLKWYGSILNAVAVCFGRQPVTEITTHQLREYIVSLRSRDTRYIEAKQKPQQTGGLSQATIDSHITALHAFWSWSSNEFLIPNPMAKIARAKRRQPTVKAITSNDFIKLFNATGIDAAGTRDRAILGFFADTGARLAGVIGLKLGDIDLSKRYAIVTEKGNQSRRVPFTQYTALLMERWIKTRDSESPHVFVSMTTGTRLSQSGVNQVLKRLKRKAGVTGRVNPHSFRHAFAREYILNGGDVVTLAKLLGHSDINTTTAYYAIFTQDELATLHEKHSPLKTLLDK